MYRGFVCLYTQKGDMTVLVKKAKSVTQSKDVMQSRGKNDSGLKADEINEFNMQTNKERKKVRVSHIFYISSHSRERYFTFLFYLFIYLFRFRCLRSNKKKGENKVSAGLTPKY